MPRVSNAFEEYTSIKPLRADVSKNQTLAGNSQKIDFVHTLNLIPYHVRRTPVQFVLKSIFSLGRN